MASDLEFPWANDNSVQPGDSFRVNINSFVQTYGSVVELPEFPGLTAWVIELRSSSGTTRLHIYEERITNNEPAICDQCRIIGTASPSALP